MHYHCKIFKEFNEKNLLTKSKIRSNIIRLRQIIDLVNYLKFELFEIILLTQFSKLTDLIIIKENEKSAIVTNDSKKIRKNRCEMSYI